MTFVITLVFGMDSIIRLKANLPSTHQIDYSPFLLFIGTQFGVVMTYLLGRKLTDNNVTIQQTKS